MAGFSTLKRRRLARAGFIAWLVVIFLTACGTSGDRRESAGGGSTGKSAAAKRPQQHRVGSGDTLYAIAFRYGLDYRELAAWNGIGPPFVIHPGDMVRLHPAYGRWAANRPPRVRTANPAADSEATRPAATTKAQTRPLPTPQSRPPVAKPTAPAITAPAKPVVVKLPVKRPTSPAAGTAAPSAGKPDWRWPTRGEVVGEYSSASALQRGLDISGPVGQPVVAAAGGEVVYSGNGLVGYGELIIIKHDDVFLSAYGHNRRRFVKEGERVAAGQKIAELGDTGANRAKLHFEIRENGKPVDPRRHLPEGQN